MIGGITPEPDRLFLIFCPVPRAMPIRLGEIGGNAEPFASEGVEEMAGDIRVFVGVERTVGCGNLVGGILAVIHTEAVMVLGGKDEVAKSVFRCEIRPLLRLKTHRVKGTVEPKVLCAELRIILCPVDLLARPGGILHGQRPGFTDAKLGVGAPVDHEGELLVSEPFQLAENERVVGDDIVVLGGMVNDVAAKGILIKICHAVAFLIYCF